MYMDLQSPESLLCKTLEKLLNLGFSGFFKFPTFTHSIDVAGLVMYKDSSFLGIACSPDGIVSCKVCGQFLIKLNVISNISVSIQRNCPEMFKNMYGKGWNSCCQTVTHILLSNAGSDGNYWYSKIISSVIYT
jgi:hypothetical protein